jgi:hypothetical protein
METQCLFPFIHRYVLPKQRSGWPIISSADEVGGSPILCNPTHVCQLLAASDTFMVYSPCLCRTTLIAIILDYNGLFCEESWNPRWGHIYVCIFSFSL